MAHRWLAYLAVGMALCGLAGCNSAPAEEPAPQKPAADGAAPEGNNAGQPMKGAERPTN